uniref:Uncharacterized protein n=1 Tax=Sphaerodactylus townsendi TaxID=933632 RepID=A0ACB8EVJ1_9SAUR
MSSSSSFPFGSGKPEKGSSTGAHPTPPWLGAPAQNPATVGGDAGWARTASRPASPSPMADATWTERKAAATRRARAVSSLALRVHLPVVGCWAVVVREQS